ncbi:lipoyl(octanoyl) transferase LipB [Pseudoxanthomonas sp. CAU 1598]|uniref:Octanoyltransferase n=1 Tax=Pseudomarimonas arenosa TaxID=2774145 RepID=A0AAW3ZIX2_9GAMM|nr:lipoyl(octanoyl) transferase LipB [Pseudomarimonas arenosa]
MSGCEVDAVETAAPAARQWHVRRLGLQPYRSIWQAMQAYTDARGADRADELWLLQHPPVFTLGQAGRWEHVLAPGDIEVVPVDRGGQVTYHGPGQIVAYPLIDLRRLGLGVRELVCRIEQAIIDTLASYSVSADRRSGAPGVYVGEKKIAALGLRVRRGCSFHGLAFNIDMDLEPFARINPCGYQGLQVCQLLDFQPGLRLSDVEDRLIEQLSRQLGLSVLPADPNVPAISTLEALHD